MGAEDARSDQETRRYRLEIAGGVSADWADWFEAESLTPEGDNTILEIRVADLSELFGRLRRIHDLNLRLISMTRIGSQT